MDLKTDEVILEDKINAEVYWRVYHSEKTYDYINKIAFRYFPGNISLSEWQDELVNVLLDRYSFERRFENRFEKVALFEGLKDMTYYARQIYIKNCDKNLSDLGIRNTA